MANREHNLTWSAGEARAVVVLVMLVLVLFTSNSNWRVQIMAEKKSETVVVEKASLTTVKCAVAATVKTLDGNIHEMTAVFPGVLIPETATAKEILETVARHNELCERIGAGALVQVMENGKPGKTITPTDDVPSREVSREPIEEEVKQPDGSILRKPTGSFTINHGQVFIRTLPSNAKDVLEAYNSGLKAKVGQFGRQTITDEFKAGGGKRGRQAAEVDLEQL